MKPPFKPQHFKAFIAVLILLLVVKILWFAVQVLWLPKSGIDQPKEQSGKALYYRVKLAPNDLPPPRRTPTKPANSQRGSINQLKLLALYNAKDITVVTVTYQGRSKVLARGENINGFVLKGAGMNYAVFARGGQRYKLYLDKTKGQAPVSVVQPSKPKPAAKKPQPKKPKTVSKNGEIKDLGDRKVIDRSLVDYYKKNYDEIGRNIGVAESKSGKGLNGFQITFVRRGSDFAKLGLRRNDVIKAINGQPINSYKAAMDLYRRIDTIDNMTFTIERGNKEMELEYEVN